MDFVKSFLKEDTEAVFLNASTRSLKVCLKSIQPKVELVIRLTAHEHKCYVDFTFESWQKILEKSQEILNNMREEEEETIFISDQLKVFTEMRHDQCAICFMDSSTGRVNMMIKTFKKWLQVSGDINSSYLKYYEKIRSKAESLQTFVQVIVQQNQGNKKKNNLPFIDVLQKLKNLPDIKASNFDVDDYDEYDSDNSDREWCNYKCRKCCYN